MMKIKVNTIFLIIVLTSFFILINCNKEKNKNKYSKERNDIKSKPITKVDKDFKRPYLDEDIDPDFRKITKPFRLAKLNLIWGKAVRRLTEPKLKSLFVELKIHDKEEIAWKQLQSDHKDKDGVKAGELRHKLIGILSTYDLLQHFDETNDPEKVKKYRKYYDKSDTHLNKSIFKDKKLNRLWEKAEISGFTADELNTLKEEFQHHQDKIDIYYNLLEDIGNDEGRKSEYHQNAVDEDELEEFNEIQKPDEIENQSPVNKKLDSNINKLRDNHREIKDNYDRLERLAARGPDSKDFIEPKVQGLWRIAIASNFSDDELASLKSELNHFESRLLKLRNLHAEHALLKEKYKDEKLREKNNRYDEMKDMIKKQSRKVEKLQELVEDKIFKHTEL